MEKIREFDEKMKLDREKFAFDKRKHEDDVSLKSRAINQKINETSKKSSKK